MFGFHEGKGKTGIEGSIQESLDDYKVNYFQIFNIGPRTYKRSNIDYDSLKLFCKKNNLSFVIHSSYVSASIWKKTLTDKALKHFEDQINSAAELKADGVVFHIPKDSIENIVDRMKVLSKIANKENIKILLESKPIKNKAYRYGDPEILNELCKALKEAKIKGFALCIDSAHLHASEIELSSYEDAKKWFDTFKYHNKIKLFHLNGSEANFGSNRDVHAIPFSSTDKIWNKYKDDIKNSGFAYFCKFAKKNGVNIIFEINSWSKKDVDFLVETTRKLL
jgi:endonuclease IV